jgi:hypothetical protein
MTVRAMSKTDRRRLWALWGGAGLYFLILLNGLRYLRELPVLTIVLGALFNGAIFTTFVVAIRRIYKRPEIGAQLEAVVVRPSVSPDSDRKRTRALWLGAGLYFVGMMIAVQYAWKLPPQYLAPAGILNMAIVLTFVVKLRKTYLPKKRSEKSN